MACDATRLRRILKNNSGLEALIDPKQPGLGSGAKGGLPIFPSDGPGYSFALMSRFGGLALQRARVGKPTSNQTQPAASDSQFYRTLLESVTPQTSPKLVDRGVRTTDALIDTVGLRVEAIELHESQ